MLGHDITERQAAFSDMTTSTRDLRRNVDTSPSQNDAKNRFRREFDHNQRQVGTPSLLTLIFTSSFGKCL
jgi:hypothetical protein